MTWRSWSETLQQDLFFAARLLWRSPAFTLFAVLMLGLGIGANTAVFSVMQAVLLRPLPYQQPNRLVVIWDHAANAKGESKLFAAYSDLLEYRANAHTLQDVSGLTWAVGGQILTGRGPSRNVLAIPVTQTFFRLIGVQPELGRTFQTEDLSRGCSVVLTHGFWSRILGRNRNIIGQSLALNGHACSVIGVMPDTFSFYPEQTALWTLLTSNSPLASKPDELAIGIFGRLAPGASIAAAQHEIAALHQRAHPNDRHGKETRPCIYPLKGEFTWLASRTLTVSLLVLFAAVTFVLLIACVNTANLLLGRSFLRRREMGLRSALGAGRTRLVRQLLTESLLLAFVAAAIGTLFAWAAVRWFRIAGPVQMPPGTRIEIDGRVLGFAAAVSITTVMLFGLIPAWSTSKCGLTEVLKSGGRGTTRRTAKSLSKGLVVFELMLSLVLLVGAGALIDTLFKFASAPMGFAPRRMLIVNVGLPPQTYSSDVQRVHFGTRLVDEVNTIPDVKGAAIASAEPLRGIGALNVLEIQGQSQPTPDRARNEVGADSVTPAFFSLSGIPLLQGRTFDSRDHKDAGATAVVNQALARAYFSGQNPIGQHVRFVDAPATRRPWLTIVGVVANEKRSTVYQEMGWVETPTLYRPWSQDPKNLTLLIWTANANATVSLVPVVTRRVAQLDSAVTVDNAHTVEDLLRTEYLAYPKFRALLLSSLAAISFLLAVVGLYGVLSQLVAQRTQEIGVRMALGAQPLDVLAGHLKEGALLAAAGIVGGIGLSWLLLRFVSSLLYGVPALDPLIVASISSALMITALTATYIPARRASFVDPIRALRYE